MMASILHKLAAALVFCTFMASLGEAYDQNPFVIKLDIPAPKPLVELCEAMMAKRPEDRPATAAEVAQQLSRWA